MRLQCSLNRGLDDVIKALENRKKTLAQQCEEFVERLMNVGIKTAKANGGEYGRFIVFSKELNPTEYGCTGMLIAMDGQKIIREWQYHGDVKSAEVSPLLMAEFGSGWHAKVLDNVEGVGQGTFPGQTHAFDPNGWWYKTLDGEKVHSYGEAPTHPMHAASLAMLFDIQRIARDVFK